MTNETICSALIAALRETRYNESTIFNYQGVIRRFHQFCSEHQITEYTPAFGNQYANDVISKKTGKFSNNRYHTQGRFIRLLDSFYATGVFDFSNRLRGKNVPKHHKHFHIYSQYQEYLRELYINENTIYFYEHELLSFFQFLENIKIYSTNLITAKVIFQYLSSAKHNRQRAVLCGVRSFLRYLNRDDLLNSIAGIRVARTKRIVKTLTEQERGSLYELIESEVLSLRNTAIVLLGLSSGIRACDLVNLKLSDVNWENETIYFCQSKTGNYVCLPLIPIVGNAIFKYVTEERPITNNDYLFIKEFSPFTPLSGHTSFYSIIKKVLIKAGIEKKDRIFGMHFLRHNAASTMINNAVAVGTIAAVLGHSDPNSTDTYITTDVRNLKECVLPFGNISREVNA